MSDPIVITYSDINAFLTCRRAFHWNYVQDFHKPEKRYGALATGTRVHKAIEHYYLTGDDPLPFYEAMVAADEEAIRTDPAAPGWALDEFYKDVIIGRNCVAARQEWLAETGADDPYEVVSVEETVSVPFLAGQVTLRGKVDVLFRDIDTGTLVINDEKTDGTWTGAREQLERSWQHSVYLIALSIAEPTQTVSRCLYTVMRKVQRRSSAKNPLVSRFAVPGTTRTAPAKRKQLEVICSEMLRSMELVMSEGDAHAFPSPGPQCKWCDYKQPCEIADESPLAARAMLDREYVRGGRHGRYT